MDETITFKYRYIQTKLIQAVDELLTVDEMRRGCDLDEDELSGR